MQVDSIAFQTDLMVRRLAGSEIEDARDHLIIRTPAIPNFWWGNFILLDAAADPTDHERWIDVFRAAFPRARHVTIGIDTTDDEQDRLKDPATAAGLSVETDAVLTAATLIPPSRPLEGAACRRLRDDDDWGQALELRNAVAAGEGDDSVGEAEFLRGYVAEARRLSTAGHGAYYGAFVEGRAMSYLGVVSDGSGTVRFQTVETHPDHRRRGLAGWLVHTAGMEGLRRFDAGRLVIVADPHGPAIHLYQSLGFTPVEHQTKLERAPD